MFLLSKPSDADIKRFLTDRESDKFSYVEVGTTLGELPRGYTVDHNRIKIGEGRGAFEKAINAIQM